MSVESPMTQNGATREGRSACPGAPHQEIIAQGQGRRAGWVRSESYEFLGDEDISKDRYIDPAYAKEEFERAVDPHLAVRLPRRAHPGGRRLLRLRHRRLFIHHHARRQERDPRLLQRLPPSRHQAARLGHARVARANSNAASTAGAGTSTARTSDVVCDWDFPHVDRKKFSLPEAQVELLGGFVLINMDPDAPTLAEYLGPEAKAHIEAWKLEDRYIYLHVVQDDSGELEAEHRGLHGGLSRHRNAPAGRRLERRRQFAVRHLRRAREPLHLDARRAQPASLRQVHGSRTSSISSRWATAARSATRRARWAKAIRRARSWPTCSAACSSRRRNTDLSAVSDSELLDCFSYTSSRTRSCSPAFRCRWSIASVPIRAIIARASTKCCSCVRCRRTASVPKPAEPIHLGDEQSFTEAEGMDPGFGAILDQDTDNLFLQQEGLEASAKRGLTLGNYQEIRVRHFEKTVDKYIAMEPKIPGAGFQVGAHLRAAGYWALGAGQSPTPTSISRVRSQMGCAKVLLPAQSPEPRAHFESGR